MTSNMVFPAPDQPFAAIEGSRQVFPLRRIFCVGRNYAAHAAEMGNEVDRSAPFYFTKSPGAFCPPGSTIPYPPGTQDCHYEAEFVVAIGAPAFKIETAQAMDVVWGFGCGIDLTRRDLQELAKKSGKPWDLSKDFEQSAPLAPLSPKQDFGAIGAQRISMEHNGRIVQDSALSDMVWSVPEVIAHLSGFYHLQPGDLIFTGTPAGVGPVAPGDRLLARVEGLHALEVTIGPAS